MSAHDKQDDIDRIVTLSTSDLARCWIDPT